MSTEQAKPTYRGNNTTISSASLKTQAEAARAEAAGATTATSTSPGTTAPSNVPRGPRKRHEHIPTSDEELKKFNKEYYVKAQSQYMDPCRAQTKASMKCMDDNNYDKRRCTRFFKDYSDCKKKWLASLREERRLRNLGIVDEGETLGLNNDTTNPSV
ncbi:Mitochondrial copper homeostasis protein [Mortierella claussenii]|nr:Mitochondrial copper homeostasis protein [Mortierella claussenii]